MEPYLRQMLWKIGKSAGSALREPALYYRKLRSKVCPLPGPLAQDKTNGVFFEYDFNYDMQVKAMYYGFYEFYLVRTMKRLLKKGGIFIDVGASIGYISSIAAGLVGESGQVHSFEPVPRHFERLQNFVKNNNRYNIVANNSALGDREGTADIAVSNTLNIGWNTMVPNLITKELTKEKIEVPVQRLDAYIKNNGLDKISLIKIDTEGFEFPVLRGLKGYFENTASYPPIICELDPDAYPLLGYEIDELSDYMEKYDYQPFSMVNNKKKIAVRELKKTTNVVFISKNEA